jgi:hypothetical protein
MKYYTRNISFHPFPPALHCIPRPPSNPAEKAASELRTQTRAPRRLLRRQLPLPAVQTTTPRRQCRPHAPSSPSSSSLSWQMPPRLRRPAAHQHWPQCPCRCHPWLPLPWLPLRHGATECGRANTGQSEARPCAGEEGSRRPRAEEEHLLRASRAERYAEHRGTCSRLHGHGCHRGGCCCHCRARLLGWQSKLIDAELLPCCCSFVVLQ